MGPKKTIQSAVNSVSNSGTINIANGVYYESSIAISKSMSIIGENSGKTIIDAQKHGASIL